MSKIRDNLKSIIVLVILVLVGVLGVLGLNTAKTLMSSASADSAPKEGTLVTAVGETATVISWSTNKEAVSGVKYGLSPASLLLTAYDDVNKADSDPPTFVATSNHRVVIRTKPGTVYYYVVENFETAKGSGGDSATPLEMFDNGGIPYSFMSKGIKGNGDGSSESNTIPTAVPTIIGVVPTAVPSTGSATTNCGALGNAYLRLQCQRQAGTGGGAGVGNSGGSGNSVVKDCDTNKDGVTTSYEKLKCLQ